MNDKLFPTYLNQGSEGIAVVLLQFWLLSFDRKNNAGLIPDGIYGQMTVMAVKDLQGYLQVEQDGDFGPATRSMLKGRLDVDFDVIPKSVAKLVPNYLGPNGPQLQE